mmetsp:Transcript_100252/g.139338  ORF Transcript_100252/g.139338 Transcript_100252/m.139338 type:complete len:163 (-) Transcript_100252:57-545(-)
MPLEPDFLHAVDGLLSSWWGHEEEGLQHAHAGVEHATAEAHQMHHSDFSSFLERPVQGSFMWTTEQLLQRRQQLRVAVGVESSVVASGTGLFIAKLMRILKRIQAEEEAKEAELETDQESQEDVTDDEDVEAAPPIGNVRLNRNLAHQKGLDDRKTAAFAHL